MMQAVRAALANVPIDEAAKQNSELRRALPALELKP
jgi:ribulose 1,5-bisphosphate carboxylase large subunit-like protein